MPISRTHALACIMRRLLNVSEAATYCGMGVGSFPVHCPVRPKRVRPGLRGLRWDVCDLDKWIDSLSPDGEGSPASSDEWLERMDAPDQSPRRESVRQQRPDLRLPSGDRNAA
jgi:hypothetical protein